jgi:hypothetical protein
VKDGILNLFDLYSPSKVRSYCCHSPMEIYFVTPFHDNDTRKCWSQSLHLAAKGKS